MPSDSRQQRRANARKSQKRPAAQAPARPTSPPPAFELTRSSRAAWLDRATALSPTQIPADLRVRALLHEAPILARYLDRYWKPTVDPFSKAVVLPGLESAAKRTPPETATELRELHALTREAQDAWLQEAAPAAGDPTTRGWHVLGEIRSALAFLVDDGVEDERDASVARAREAHAQDGEGQEDLASALDDFAAVARPHAAELDGVGGFDRAMIEEAPRLAATLRERGDVRAEVTAGSRATMQLRNRYAALLAERMTAARATARYVFRHHPKVAQEAGSAAVRARAAASRKKKAAKPTPPANPK